MIKGLTVKNWMCFKEQSFDFVGVNLLYGKNNTGKSALLKHLLAYQQSALLSHFIFSPNGNYVALGDQEDILYCYQDENHFDSKLTFDNDAILDQIYIWNKKTNYFIAFRNNLHQVNQIYNLSSLMLTEPLFNERFHYVHPKAYHGRSTKQINSIIDNLLRENKDYIIGGEKWSAERLFTFFDARNANHSQNAKYLCALLNVKPGDLLIMEHPVCRMHPKMQSTFTHLMTSIAKQNVQMFVESHSDHMVNAMLVAVKQENIHQDNVNLFFFEMENRDDECYSTVQVPRIEKGGSLEYYPVDLMKQFDDDMTTLIS